MEIKNLKKKLVPAVAGAGAAIASCVPVFASESGTGLSSVETAMTSSFTEVGNSMISMVGKVLPIALPVMGALVPVSYTHLHDQLSAFFRIIDQKCFLQGNNIMIIFFP